MTAASVTRQSQRLRTQLTADLDASFAQAAAAGATERTYVIADEVLRLRFAPSALERMLTPALAHLEQRRARASLTIDVWDSATSGAPRAEIAAMPSAASADAQQLEAPGASYHYRDEAVQALHQPAPDIFCALAADGSHGWFWIADAPRLPYWDCAAPFRHLLSWWLSERGVLLVHGGAVGTARGGVLFVGRGGSGKSTAALSGLLDARLLYAGDDYVALSTEPGPWIHSLYCSGKVDAGNLVRVQHLEGLVTNPQRLPAEKAVVDLGGRYRDRLTPGFPLVAIVVPKITPHGPRLVVTSSALAFSALAPSTILQRRPPRPAELTELRRLTEAVPSFVLEGGPDPRAIPGAIAGLIDELVEEREP